MPAREPARSDTETFVMAETLIKVDLKQSAFDNEQVLSFALDVADRVLVIENGEIVRDDPRDGVEAAQISKYLSV